MSEEWGEIRTWAEEVGQGREWGVGGGHEGTWAEVVHGRSGACGRYEGGGEWGELGGGHAGELGIGGLGAGEWGIVGAWGGGYKNRCTHSHALHFPISRSFEAAKKTQPTCLFKAA